MGDGRWAEHRDAPIHAPVGRRLAFATHEWRWTFFRTSRESLRGRRRSSATTFPHAETMRPALLLALALLALPAAAQTSPVGDWRGVLDLGPTQLPLVIHVAQDGDGFSTTLDSPDQGAFGIPTTSTTIRNDSLLIDIAMIQGRLDLAVGADSLRGTFSQMGNTLPIVMGPAEPIRRPQTPAAPFPYRSEEVSAESAPGVTLAGTLTLPEGTGPFPAVVLVSGTGPQDRDMTIAEHQTFAVLADALTRAGIATLRFDDRGAGASTGDYATATLDDLVLDARAMLGLLKARADVSMVGVVGHSEGGYTALRLRDEADFLVSMAGPAVTGADLYVRQMEAQALLAGVDSSGAVQFGAAIRAAMAPMLAAPDAPTDSLLAATEDAFNQGLIPMRTAARTALGLSGPGYPQVRTTIAQFLLSPGFRSFARFDPAPHLAALTTPTLALFGGLDSQVPADQNAPPLRDAIAGRAGSEVVVFDAANHLFQTAETGAIQEYGQIEQTIDPVVLARLVAWIEGITGLSDH
jgi:dienelactone hydrolase